jgi:hypothetical protein
MQRTFSSNSTSRKWKRLDSAVPFRFGYITTRQRTILGATMMTWGKLDPQISCTTLKNLSPLPHGTRGLCDRGLLKSQLNTDCSVTFISGREQNGNKIPCFEASCSRNLLWTFSLQCHLAGRSDHLQWTPWREIIWLYDFYTFGMAACRKENFVVTWSSTRKRALRRI